MLGREFGIQEDHDKDYFDFTLWDSSFLHVAVVIVCTDKLNWRSWWIANLLTQLNTYFTSIQQDLQELFKNYRRGNFCKQAEGSLPSMSNLSCLRFLLKFLRLQHFHLPPFSMISIYHSETSNLSCRPLSAKQRCSVAFSHS